MNVNDLFSKKYLAKEDVKQPTVTTIAQVTQVEMNDKGAKVMKPVIFFAAFAKPMVLNKLNAQILASFLGSDTDVWPGKPVEVYVDPTVMMEGRMVGGVRVRQSQQHAAPAEPSAALRKVDLWDYSDGTPPGTRRGQTTEQVLAHLGRLAAGGGPLPVIKVRPAGSTESPVMADVWYANHAPTAIPVGADDPIPF